MITAPVMKELSNKNSEKDLSGFFLGNLSKDQKPNHREVMLFQKID